MLYFKAPFCKSVATQWDLTIVDKNFTKNLPYSRIAVLYYVSKEKIIEHDILKLKQLKRWLGENTISATRV